MVSGTSTVAVASPHAPKAGLVSAGSRLGQQPAATAAGTTPGTRTARTLSTAWIPAEGSERQRHTGDTRVTVNFGMVVKNRLSWGLRHSEGVNASLPCPT
ncbi:hypothetical protein SLITK23_58330 [Streptomyces lividans]|nr:hypothetical protein SLITK23_58330 [Streptomyces lividans]